MHLRTGALLAGAAITACGAAWAQAVPDAGALSQQLPREERVPAVPRSNPPAPDTRPALPPMPQVQGVSVIVQRFAIAGNTRIGTSELELLLLPYLNRPLGFPDLQAATTVVAEQYRAAGWVVRAYLPAQDLGDGVVTIQVLETTLGEVRYAPDPAAQLPVEQVHRIFESQLQAGAALNAGQVDRALLLSNDLPGTAAEASLAEGATLKSTDVLVKLVDRPAAFAVVSADNAGSESTGSYRLSADGEFGNPAGLGDRINWNWVHAEGSDYARLGYNLPLGGDGWRVGLLASTFGYKLTSSDLAALHAAGTSDVNTLEASYPLIRSRQRNLRFNLSYEQKTFENRANGAVATRYRSDSTTLGLSGNSYDASAGNAILSGSISLAGGNLDLNGSPNQAGDASSTQAAGSFNKLRYSLSRQQDMAPGWVLYAALYGQVSDKNLDSSERLYLGGPDGVRAYPVGEAGGSEGNVISLELRWRATPAWTLTPFYDWGQIHVNRFNNFTGGTALNDYALEGGGLSLTWQSAVGSNVKLSWARRSQGNPNPTPAGTDQDGSKLMDRIWLSANVFF